MGFGGVDWVVQGWVGYLWFNYECFPISGCKDVDKLQHRNTTFTRCSRF